MFSVVIPLYNKANFIAKTVETVLKQTVTDFEIVIVNDGSTDNSLEVVQAIKDSRIKIINKKNEGVSAARNYGIYSAKFDYIAFLDADDLWKANHLENLREAIEQYPNVYLYATAYLDRLKEKDVLINGNFDCITQFEDYPLALKESKILAFWTGSVCIRRDFFFDYQAFAVGINRGEDQDLWLRASILGAVIHPQPTAMYIHETENNIMMDAASLDQSFPYEKWFDYNCVSKNGLYWYTNSLLTTQAIIYLKHNMRYKAWRVLLKTRGLAKWKQKIKIILLLMTSLIHEIFDGIRLRIKFNNKR